MKILIFFLCFINFLYAKNHKIPIKWKFSKDCSRPESIYFDKESGFVFVSSIVGEGAMKDGVGHIAKLSIKGKVLNAKWIEGLNAPKGMRAHNGILWVSDIDRVVAINIKKNKIIKSIKIKDAQFLNDIAISPEGDIFVSDTLSSKIYLISNYKVSIFMEGDILESPNGLLYKDNKLFVASWGLTNDWSTKIAGRLYFIDMKSHKISYVTTGPLGNLDGLEVNRHGDFIVSDWGKGKIFKITKSGQVSLLYQGKKGLADIGYIPESDTLLIPYMLDSYAIGI